MIYLTGANGWLGLNMVRCLQSGRAASLGLTDNSFKYFILKNTDKIQLNLLAGNCEITEGDIVTGEGLDRFFAEGAGGTLIHTVGVIHPPNVKAFYDINLEGTKNVLDAAIKAGIKRAVIVSSNSPIGCNPHPDHLFDELSPYHPYMNYGKSKMKMELMVKEYEQRGDIETVIVRAPWFYGSFQPARQKLFFNMVRDGKAPIVGSGENLRSMAFMQNLADGLALCASVEKAKGQIYWIADERPYSMNEIVDTIERLLESEFNQSCKHKRMHLPGLASDVAFMVDYGMQALGMYNQKIHVLSEMNKTIACSIEKAKTELGYKPEISLEAGMRISLKELFN
jgi:nucleoside-diphosphate-sugar epimerase